MLEVSRVHMPTVPSHCDMVQYVPCWFAHVNAWCGSVRSLGDREVNSHSPPVYLNSIRLLLSLEYTLSDATINSTSHTAHISCIIHFVIVDKCKASRSASLTTHRNTGVLLQHNRPR